MKALRFLVIGLVFTGLLTSCKEETDPTPFELASASTGGVMYDKFWSVESGFDQLDPNVALFAAKSDFFRCKQCHAWDLKGDAASYINRGANANRPRVSGLDLFTLAKSASADELFEDIKKTSGRRDIGFDLTTYDPITNSTEGDKMPNYSQILTDDQIWDLVKFLKEGAIDVTQLYDYTTTGSYPTGTYTPTNFGKDGNATSGKSFYTSQCQGCHGADGTTISLGGKTVGKFLRTSPHEVQHKVQYGQLGSTMTGQFNMTVSQMKDLYKALANTTDFPD